MINITIKNPKLQPFEPLRIEVVVKNTTKNTMVVPGYLSYTPFFNGEFIESTSGKKSLESYSSNQKFNLLPGEQNSYTFKQDIELCFIPKKQGVVVVDFKLNIGFGNHYGTSHSQKIQVDFSEFQPIISEKNTASNYYRCGNTLFYYSHKSRAYESAITVLKGNAKEYHILNENYAINATQVFNDGRLQRGISSNGFKVYNYLFSGNVNHILTRYGKAKVAHPKSFKVLDDGQMPSLFSSMDGYKCGYAVDEAFAYYFDESTSTAHAIKIKACKTPETLKSLGYGYATDDKNVYLEGKKILKAKPNTFKILNRYYTTDGKRIFCYHREVCNVDLQTFKILPEIEYKNDTDLLDSKWAKDKNHYYRMGFPEEKAKYHAD